MRTQQHTERDPYRRYAGFYDRLFESMNKGLRLVGIRLFRPRKGMKILDVGCGTGTCLELLERYGCDLYGLDRSPSMLAVARDRLGDNATLDLGDATDMPYDEGQFDLVIAMLALHEMSPETQTAVLSEMKRVLNGDGRILLIDYSSGRVQGRQGWQAKAVILLAELAAGREHFRNYRHFMASGGLPALQAQQGLDEVGRRVLAGGTFAAYLTRKAQ